MAEIAMMAFAFTADGVVWALMVAYSRTHPIWSLLSGAAGGILLFCCLMGVLQFWTERRG